MSIYLFPRVVLFYLLFLFFIIPLSAAEKNSEKDLMRNTDTLIVKTAFTSEGISPEWKEAIKSRMSKVSIDSFGQIKRPLSSDEIAWKLLIESKATTWNQFRDSLAVPFKDIVLNDTIVVLLGLLGVDDGFTYGSQTVCLDITALARAYGKASLAENDDRINRIFAHEYTHLLHKAWANKNNMVLSTFKDSILWECLYEGIGMYRSLNPKWLPANDSLPKTTKDALASLYPIFAERIKTIHSSLLFTPIEKEKLNANLSRGQVNQKWGAFPMAIWLALEARRNPGNLATWINKGPASVIELARKYLTPVYKMELYQLFKKSDRQ